jgi:hypothetical protein
MIGNHLRVVRVDELLASISDSDLHEHSRLIRLGQDSDGAGDPAELAILPNGGLAVALAGVGEVAFQPTPGFSICRTTVGRRPSAVALSTDGETVYVADMLDDTISVVGIGTESSTRQSLGPSPGAQPGRPRRAAVLRRQAFPRWLAELPQLPHRRAHQRPAQRHSGRRFVWSPSASLRSWALPQPVPGCGPGRRTTWRTRFASRSGRLERRPPSQCDGATRVSRPPLQASSDSEPSAGRRPTR